MKEEFNILNQIKKENPDTGFSVPDHYFDSFDDQMMSLIESKKISTGKKVVMILKPWLSLAAIFTLITLVYYVSPISKTNNQIADASFTTEVSLEYLSPSFDEYELIDIIIDNENNAIFDNINSDPNLLEGLTYEDIEDIVIF
ncbi:hypothetical protein [Plebeiibacterium marinum]|uniref:Uncharacterized protein n=1 Tax=Plebeiibacterium marinum TaxID=2992111 RepID=A0AAE3MHQ8_9BACT|nr:hypothetical protein [Plebeiobacterium marinum]MCW3807287.1 hypothetical protein [Plebeiobacterium marinum]